MTEIATREFNALATGFARTPSAPAQRSQSSSEQFARMGQWIELFMATEQVAQVLARTAFVPEPMRGQPENIAAAMMKSLELGIDPLDGLSNLHVVKGKIGYSAEFMRRRIIEAGHDIEFDEATDDRCKIRGRRAGATEWQTVVFTADNARKAKIQLGDYPADKLVARASSRLCRRVFPDVLAGATIVDELEDNVEVVDSTVAGSAPVQRKRQPRAVKAREAKPAPSVDDDLLDEPAEAPSDSRPKPETAQVTESQDDLLDEPADPPTAGGDQPATTPQNRKMHALFREADIEDRAERLTITSAIIGRTIATSSEMTIADANTLIDQLEEWRSTNSLADKLGDVLDMAAIAAEAAQEGEN